MNRMRLIVFVLSIIFTASLSAQTPTDVEKFFSSDNNGDLSGTYQVTGTLNSDGTEYNGPAVLEKWNTFTTQRGKVLQSYKIKFTYFNQDYTGIAVFDGKRLYYATGVKPKDNYHLMVISRLVLSPENSTALSDFGIKVDEAKKKGKNVVWQGKSPWFGYFGWSFHTDAFGYHFNADGAWGEYTLRETGFPNVGDTGSYRTLDLKKNGEHDDKDVRYGVSFSYIGGFIMEQRGPNVDVSALKYDDNIKGNKFHYGGSGMFVTEPSLGDSLLVGMMGGPEYTVYGWYELKDGSFAGVWSWLWGSDRANSSMAVPDNVKQKNPAWFK